MLLKTAIIFLSFLLCVVCTPGSLLDHAKKLGLSELVKYIYKAGLNDLYDTKGPFTFFAPTDAAFRSVPPSILKEFNNNPGFLENVMIFHLVEGPDVYEMKNFYNDESLSVVYTSHELRINVYNSSRHRPLTYTADGACIIHPRNVKATNGILHVIDKVMYQLPEDTVFTFVAKHSSFTNLTTAIQKTNLQSILTGLDTGPWTMFAPTDEGFAKLPRAEREALFDNTTALKEVLQYHMVQGTFYSRGLEESNDLKTALRGQAVHVSKSRSGTMIVNSKFPVKMADIPVNNGVIYVLDNVLIPKKLTQPR